MKQKYRNPIIIITLVMVFATTGLIIANASSPGFCPPYPLLGFPACVVMAAYFLIILMSQFVKNKSISNYMFYIPAILAFATGTFFSVKEIMGLSHCPRVFDIPLPLCFTVIPMVGILLFLKIRGDMIAAKQSSSVSE